KRPGKSPPRGQAHHPGRWRQSWHRGVHRSGHRFPSAKLVPFRQVSFFGAILSSRTSSNCKPLFFLRKRGRLPVLRLLAKAKECIGPDTQNADEPSESHSRYL